jgi:hypothetical protein
MNATAAKRMSCTAGRVASRHHGARWRALALVAAALSLAGCETLPPGLGGSGQASQPPARDAAVAGDAARAVAVGQGTARALATFEGDMTCTRLVAPFQLSDNLDELARLGKEIGALLARNAATNAMGQLIDGRRGLAGQTLQVGAQQARHVIPQELRARAVLLNWLPMPAERRYGEMALERMKAELLPREGDRARRLYEQAGALLAQVLRGVDEPHDYQFTIHLATGSAGTAVALPGGLIVLDALLLERPQLELKAQYAVAHEVAHVLQRHETRALQARIIDTLVVSGRVVDLYQSVRSLRGDPGPVLQLLFQGKLQFQRHYGDQEMHADACAIRILDRALSDRPRMHNVVQAFVTDLNVAAAKLPAAGLQASGGAVVNVASPANPPWASIGSALVGAAGTAVAASASPPAGGSTGAAQPAAPSPLDDLVTMVTSPIDRHPDPQRRVKHIRERLVSFPLPATAPATASTGSPAGKPAAGTTRGSGAPARGTTPGAGAASGSSAAPASRPPAKPPHKPGSTPAPAQNPAPTPGR